MPDIDQNLLTIFSQPSCVQCTAAERHAKARNIPYQKVDVTEVSEAYTLITKEWGYMRAPVLYYQGEHSSGFDVDFLATVEKSFTQVAA